MKTNLRGSTWKWMLAITIAGCQCVANGSNLFVAGYGSSVVEEFDTVTQASSTFASGLARPMGLAFDAAGNLYVGDYSASTIYEYSPNGVATTFATTGLRNPMDIAVDNAGNVFAANQKGNTITEYGPGGAESLFASVSVPQGLTFDSAGSLYASTQGNFILQYNSQGQATVIGTSSDGLNDPVGMEFNSAGDLFVANYGGRDILERDGAGNWSIFASVPPGYSNPVGLAIDGSTIYVSCAGNFIEEYDSSGNGTRFASTDNGPYLLAIAPMPEPSTISVAAIGAAMILLRLNKRRLARVRGHELHEEDAKRTWFL